MKAVLINRIDRPERLQKSQEQFDQYGLDVEVFPAIISNPGWKGCRDSHLAILEKYKDERFILIFEDDVLFLNDPLKPIAEVTEELPHNWDMLYLGINPQEKYDRYSPHLFKVKKGYCAHAVLYHNREHGVIDFILSHKGDIKKWDVFLSLVVNSTFNCYVIWPILVTQWQHKSDTCIRTDSSCIIRNYNKFVNDN